MTRGERQNLLRLVYRLEVLAQVVGQFNGLERAHLRSCKRAEAQLERLRRQIEAALGFPTGAYAAEILPPEVVGDG